MQGQGVSGDPHADLRNDARGPRILPAGRDLTREFMMGDFVFCHFYGPASRDLDPAILTIIQRLRGYDVTCFTWFDVQAGGKPVRRHPGRIEPGTIGPTCRKPHEGRFTVLLRQCLDVIDGARHSTDRIVFQTMSQGNEKDGFAICRAKPGTIELLWYQGLQRLSKAFMPPA